MVVAIVGGVDVDVATVTRVVLVVATVVVDAIVLLVAAGACARELLLPHAEATSASAASGMSRAGPRARTRPILRTVFARRCALIAAALLAATACGSSTSTSGPSLASSTSTLPATTAVPEATTTTTVAPTTTTTTVPPTTTTVAAFTGTVTAITAADVPSTYHSGCPVTPEQLRMLHMSYWGFDGNAHGGTMVVNQSVTQAVLSVFARLYSERFPIRKMVPEDAFGGSDPKSMDADNTSGFNCRNAVAPGPPHWSAHAYGEAIDVNPVENPYLEGGAVQPAAGAAFTDRTAHRPGMAFPGGELVSAFASAGWPWGGRWSAPDYQHFSANGG